MAGDSKQRARRRTNLWRANPHCHWCRRLTVLPGPEHANGPQPDDLATLDHLRSWLNEERIPGRQWPHGSNTVLACARCNRTRNDEEQAAMSIEELHQRCGHGERFAMRNLCLTSLTTLSSLPSL